MTDELNGNLQRKDNYLQYFISWMTALTNRPNEDRSFPPYAVLEILEIINKGTDSTELYKGK